MSEAVPSIMAQSWLWDSQIEVKKKTCDIIYVRTFTHAYAYFLILKNEPIQKKIIPFTESSLKIKEVLDKAVFLIVLNLAVYIESHSIA